MAESSFTSSQMRDHSEIITDIASALTVSVEPLQFTRVSSQDTDTEYWLSWERVVDWRVDEIRMSWSKFLADAVILHLQVEVLCNNRRVRVDGTTVGYLTKQSSGEYRFPNAISSLLGGRNRFTLQLVRDVRRALAWFQQFSSPDEVIAYLKVGQGNAPRPNSEVSRELIACLESLQK